MPKQTQELQFCPRPYLPEVILGRSVRISLDDALGMSSCTLVLVHVRIFLLQLIGYCQNMTNDGGGYDKSIQLGLAATWLESPEDIGVTQIYGCHAPARMANQKPHTKSIRIVSR